MNKSKIKVLAKRVSRKFKLPVPGKAPKINKEGVITDGIISYF